jgi:PPIC-type PPIASE domain
MGCRLLVLIMLVCSLAFGFQAPAEQAPSGSGESGEKAAPQIALDAPVITLDGPCMSGASNPASSTKSNGAGSEATAAPALAPVSVTPTDSGCKIVITRAEFEQLINGLHPGGSPSATLNFAKHYSETLLLAEKAHESGFDQDPGLQARARFAYLQLLGQSFNMQLREKATVVSDAEVETYYKQNPEMFEQVELMRVFVPSLKEYSSGPRPSQEQLAADKVKMEAEAQKIYKQALAGASFEKLEEKAYKLAGNPEDTPPVQMGKLTRNAIPQQYREMILALKIGQISELTLESNGWSIFKVVSKRTMPLSEAKPQVQQLKADAAVGAIKNSMKLSLNDAYFGTPEATTKAPNMKR